jgi:hypothetical protein
VQLKRFERSLVPRIALRINLFDRREHRVLVRDVFGAFAGVFVAFVATSRVFTVGFGLVGSTRSLSQDRKPSVDYRPAATQRTSILERPSRKIPLQTQPNTE